MSQVDDYSLGNLSFPAARARINALLAAIRASNAGPTAPTNPAAGMTWLDTSVSPAVLRQRSGDNTTWLRVAPELPVPVGQGGTGATTAADARTALGATTVGNAVFAAADAATARTALGAAAVADLPPALTQGQVQNAGDTTQGTVSGQRLAQAFDARQQQIGVGQLWRNHTPWRTNGVIYQNTTGRTIAVSIRSGSTNVNTHLDVGDTHGTMLTVSEYGSGATHRISTCTAIVPPGHFYRYSGQVAVWAELM